VAHLVPHKTVPNSAVTDTKPIHERGGQPTATGRELARQHPSVGRELRRLPGASPSAGRLTGRLPGLVGVALIQTAGRRCFTSPRACCGWLPQGRRQWRWRGGRLRRRMPVWAGYRARRRLASAGCPGGGEGGRSSRCFRCSEGSWFAGRPDGRAGVYRPR